MFDSNASPRQRRATTNDRTVRSRWNGRAAGRVQQMNRTFDSSLPSGSKVCEKIFSLLVKV